MEDHLLFFLQPFIEFFSFYFSSPIYYFIFSKVSARNYFSSFASPKFSCPPPSHSVSSLFFQSELVEERSWNLQTAYPFNPSPQLILIWLLCCFKFSILSAVASIDSSICTLMNPSVNYNSPLVNPQPILPQLTDLKVSLYSANTYLWREERPRYSLKKRSRKLYSKLIFPEKNSLSRVRSVFVSKVTNQRKLVFARSSWIGIWIPRSGFNSLVRSK